MPDLEHNNELHGAFSTLRRWKARDRRAQSLRTTELELHCFRISAVTPNVVLPPLVLRGCLGSAGAIECVEVVHVLV